MTFQHSKKTTNEEQQMFNVEVFLNQKSIQAVGLPVGDPELGARCSTKILCSFFKTEDFPQKNPFKLLDYLSVIQSLG
ncbi:hypothetical protein [Flavobacterium sp.]|uniref:hypothetical protein n=1 Tax=Flavobacterium sp. TaxID=239 RepID=UPI002B4AB91E|nr:hypothetical protein [Flavobacterium sp.]HLP64427.1 hypothetical protein [Flavobacterium sp.]